MKTPQNADFKTLDNSDFESRLENWGAYFRTRKRPNESTTYKICARLADRAGQTYKELNPRPEIDADDAETIEYCWRMCAHRVSATHRAILRAYFVNREDVRVIARVLKIRWRSFDSEKSAALRSFESAVQLIELSRVSTDKKTSCNYIHRM